MELADRADRQNTETGRQNAKYAGNENQIEKRAFSSVGRASPLQGEGQKFESFNAHHKKDRRKRSFLIGKGCHPERCRQKIKAAIKQDAKRRISLRC